MLMATMDDYRLALQLEVDSWVRRLGKKYLGCARVIYDADNDTLLLNVEGRQGMMTSFLASRREIDDNRLPALLPARIRDSLEWAKL